jgi:hypothetical protein
VDAVRFGNLGVGVGEDVEIRRRALWTSFRLDFSLSSNWSFGATEIHGMSASTSASGPCFSTPAG